MCNSSHSLNLSLHTLLKVVFRIGFFLSLQAGMVRTGASWCRSENSSTCVLLSSLSWALYFLFICTCLLNCCGYHALHPKQTVSFNAFLGSDGTPFCPLYCVVYLECMGHHSLLTHVITLLVWLICVLLVCFTCILLFIVLSVDLLCQWHCQSGHRSWLN